MKCALNTEKAKQIYKYILRHFAETGRAPTSAQLQREFNLPSQANVEEFLAEIERRGGLYRDPKTHVILSAYPFSSVPTVHRVKLASGLEVYAMCAIDALGMPFMLDTDATITSSCQSCGKAIEIEIQGGQIVSHAPPDILVWHSTQEACCAAAVDRCPFINFFCSPQHIAIWQKGHPQQQGKVLGIAEAVEAGKQIFAHLLRA